MEYVTIFESDDNHSKSSIFGKMIRHFAKKNNDETPGWVDEWLEYLNDE